MYGDEFLKVLEAAVAGQAEHAVVPRIRVRVIGQARIEMKSHLAEWMEVGPGEVMEALELRARAIALEVADPYHHGMEPEFWGEIDWAVCGLRALRPGVVLELYVLGGNRASKTEFCGKRLDEAMVENRDWYTWGLHSDEGSSQAIQQSRIWKYLPADIKPSETGKYKKTVTAKLSYNALTGFTENAFALHNGSKMKFKFYSADVKSVEGAELDVAWSDELIPLNWVQAMEYRLLTRAAHTRKTALECAEALRMREHGEISVIPRELRKRLYQGVHMVSFTAVQGYTATVGRACDGAVTVKSEAAELLPVLDEDGKVTAHEQVPRVQLSPDGKKVVAYLHTKDNKHGGNWEGMKATLEGAARATILVRAYGVPTKAFQARFPLFSDATHVRPRNRMPQGGQWWHIVDPCNGRNYFMLWITVNELGECFVAREWPQRDDSIPGVGQPGDWAEPSTGNRKDGDRGPAQEGWGLGITRYKEEFRRVELDLGARDAGTEKKPGTLQRVRIADGNRIMDSRAGNTASLAHSEAETLISKFEETNGGLDEAVTFYPAGKSSGAAQGTTGIDESVDLINDLLWYDAAKTVFDPVTGAPTFNGAAPKLYVADTCTNLIFALKTWTGADGLTGACKDPVDCLRYFAMANPVGDALERRGGAGRDGSGGYGGGSF